MAVAVFAEYPLCRLYCFIQKLFLIMSGGLLLAIIYCTAMALTVPYMLEHQERFKPSVSPLGFAFSYVLDMAAILVAMVTVRVSMQPSQL
jgi:hypothetical protein